MNVRLRYLFLTETQRRSLLAEPFAETRGGRR
jgi:hypothetical protein